MAVKRKIDNDDGQSLQSCSVYWLAIKKYWKVCKRCKKGKREERKLRKGNKLKKKKKIKKKKPSPLNQKPLKFGRCTLSDFYPQPSPWKNCNHWLRTTAINSARECKYHLIYANSAIKIAVCRETNVESVSSNILTNRIVTLSTQALFWWCTISQVGQMKITIVQIKVKIQTPLFHEPRRSTLIHSSLALLIYY